jgi:hypothetical protein
MSTLALALLIILTLATAMFYIAGGPYGHSAPWAVDVCYSARPLCRNPEWIAYATVVVAIAYVLLRRSEV